MRRALQRAAVIGALAVGLPAGELSLAERALAQLRIADQQRAELARERAAWQSERQRLEAMLATLTAENERLAAALTEARQAHAAALARAVDRSAAEQLDDAERRLQAAAAQLHAALSTLAGRLLPGTLPPLPASASLADLERLLEALAAAERAASALRVCVVVGERAGQPEAVKALSVSGAAGWWLSLDGMRAGCLRIREGRVLLTDCDPEWYPAIREAVAQAEGRAPARVLLLPDGGP
ncbi:MAG: hypothetical protein N3B15_03005 [Planctomycetota bacterium]|nr:hypothetical protein [Planctomycetota bacterium]